MAHHKVEISGLDTTNIKVLSSDEMEELFKKMQSGDDLARKDLVNGNLKLVLSILKKFNHKNENLDDLFQIGCIGLLKAIDNFDLAYGVKFSTYCVPMIEGEIKRYLRDNSAIRVSRSVKDLAYKAIRLKDELTVETGCAPTTLELAEMLGVSEFEIVNAIESMRDPMSIFEPIYNDGGDTIYLYDQIEDKNERKDLDIKMAVDKAIGRLNDREQYIIDQRFIIGKTQMEIASELGISQAQVSRIEKTAINRIKSTLQ